MSEPILRSLNLTPTKPGTCPECGTEHLPDEPHNLHSLYYQIRFQAQRGRYPTWEDAMAHCDDDTRRAWREALQAEGA
jgi:hypothetical protein